MSTLLSDSTAEQIKVSTILQTIQSGYWLFDLQGSLLDVNDIYCRMSGYSREELLQMHIWDLDVVENPPEVLERIRLVQAHGSDQFERRHRRKDGSVFDVDIRTACLDGAHGRMITFVWDITQRKQIEADLKASEEKARNLVKYAPAAIYEIDFFGHKFLSVNDGVSQLTGYSREELLGMDPLILADEESKALFLEQVRRKLAGESVEEYVEMKITNKEGRQLIVSLDLGAFTYQGGKPVSALVIAQDITDRIEKEKELSRLNRTLKALSGVNQVMVRVTAEADLLAAVCRIIIEDCGHPMVWIGYAEDDEAKSVRPVAYAGFEAGYLETLKVTWADTARGRGPTGTAIRTGKPAGCKNTLTDPNFAPWRDEALKRGYASSFVVPLLAGEKAMGAITIYSREPESFTDQEVDLLVEMASDLTYGIQALRMRAAHAQTEESLRESEERYRRLVDLAPEGIGVHDGQTWLYINQAGMHLFGATELTEIVGKPVLSFIHPDDREMVEGRVQLILRADQIAPVRELRLRRVDGREIYIEASGIKTIYLGKPAIQTIYKDVTERKRTQEALQKARDELEVRVEERTEELVQANRKLAAALSQEQAMRDHLIQSEKFTAMGRLLASVAHELNNPLQTIKNCLYLIRQVTPPESPVQEYLEMSVSETRRLSNLVGQLRELYRPQGAVVKPASLTSLLTDAGSLLAPHLANNGTAWVLNPPVEDYTINCIADQIKQVFINICMNAVEAMQPGGGTLSIRVVPPGADGLVGISFQDSGPGIPPDVLGRLFEPFFTTKPSGLGLGLSITYELIQRHQGRITVESHKGQGAAFTVWLPVLLENNSQP